MTISNSLPVGQGGKSKDFISHFIIIQILLKMSYQNSIIPQLKNTNTPVNFQEMELLSEHGSEHSEAYKKHNKSIRLNPLDVSVRMKKQYQPVSNTASPTKQLQNSSSTLLNPSPQPNRFKSNKVKKGYELARYQKAEKHLHSRSYKRKVVSRETGDVDYEDLQICGSNEQLKEYGLGIYLYLQFIKRLAITLFIISVVLIFPLVESFKGQGLAKYTKSGSFTMTLARFSLGNISNGNQQTYLIISIADALSVIIMLIFYLHWRAFHKAAIQELERDSNILNPISYALSVDQFFDETTSIKTLEKQLKTYIDAIYRGAYEVEIVYNYNGNFNKFIEYEEQIELVEKQNQIMKQTNKDSSRLLEEQNKLKKMENELEHISQAFEPQYAIIHFRNLKAKLTFINHCKRFKLTNSLGERIARSICCTPNPPPKYMFLQKFPLSIRSNRLSRPEEINWSNNDLTTVSIVIRYILSLVLVFIIITITSALISLATLYAAGISSCQTYIAPTATTITTQISYAKTQPQAYQFCYCNDNFQLIYTDTEINSFCKTNENKVLMVNGLQIAASFVSAVSNVILCIFVSLIANKVLRPATIPKEFIFVFWCVLISNYLNTAVLPLVINANIYGTQFVNYIKFINFMDFNSLSIFSDFTADWYAIFSPYYVNFVIIASFITPLAGLLVMTLKNCLRHWKVMRMCNNSDKENPVIQKEANAAIADIKFDYPVQTAQVLLMLFIVFIYSGLIPLLIPIYALGLILTYFCKRTMILKYSLKIPADHHLNQSVINFLPYAILFHGLFSLWSHTTPGIFQDKSQIYSLSITIFKSQFDRIFKDVIILAEPVLVIVLIFLDYTIFNFLGCLVECCKDELEMPIEFAAIENAQFSERLQKSNILGSYKLINSPVYSMALKAYNELAFRATKNREDSELNISRN